MKRILAIVGATASGKSSLALSLAERHCGEIVSCDSMQIYRGMDIGTAKPTAEVMSRVPHHLIDVADPGEDFSAGDFASLAASAVDEIAARGNLPVFCGGTFLYLDALTEISSLSDSSKDGELRRTLSEYAENNGAHALHEMLRGIDPEAADSIHENNVKRVIRAIEIYKTTGKTKTAWDAESKRNASPYDVTRLLIDYRDRSVLYGRIDERVDKMIGDGLEDEAKRLFDAGYLSPDRTASGAIGYKEFIPYFKGEATLGEVIEEIKRSTRNYAKRQMTWLRRYKDALTVYGDGRSAKEIYDDAESLLFSAGFFER